ncbi:MAG: aminoacyl-tRNA hydrolase [Candidatus Babeliaceae bacterium]
MEKKNIKVIIGLGNPGPRFENTRHNIGFKIIDTLAEKYGASWKMKNNYEFAQIILYEKPVILIKPQTFMNNAGDIMPHLQKMGVNPEEILVVHDELELPFGKLAIKQGGSAKGHNGLKSLIAQIGENFMRLRFGIGRPANREDVPDYVLEAFSKAEQEEIIVLIDQAIQIIEQQILAELK